jgi:hypothetical protein
MPADTRVSARRFDFSRETFDPARHRRSVVGLQGRVTVEADQNEQRRIDLHRSDTTTRDVIGPAGVPSDGNGFLIAAKGGDLGIAAGQMYVDGILCENETDCTLLTQPDLPVKVLGDVPGFDPSPGTPPAANTVFAVELQVWERDITPIDDPALLEKALGGPDTSARTETVWQVVLKAQSDPTVTCAKAAIDTSVVHDGVLSAKTVASAAARDCTLPPLAGYQGLENQLYRVEIHKGGVAGVATFKWSRENASVVTGIVATPPGTLGQTFTVQSIGADQTLGFAANQWVELTDDGIELLGGVGVLAFIQSVDPAKQQITLNAAPGAPIDLAKNPKMRRWDQTDPTQSTGVPTVAAGWVPLESGIQVQFGSGTFQPGDYWIIPARTAIDETTGTLDWPSTPQPAQFAERHVALLALVKYLGTAGFDTPHDCRPKFDNLVTLTQRKAAGCCTVSVGDGGDYAKIMDAIKALPLAGGEICILPGTYKDMISIKSLKNISIHGCHGRTLLIGDGTTTPVITIEDSQGIDIHSLAIASDTASAISMDSTYEAFTNNAGLSAIRIADLDIDVRDGAAIVCRDGQDIRIEGNRVNVKQLAAPLSATSAAGFSPAIFLLADQAEINRNVLTCAAATALTTALGGIQIGGGSSRVTICGNVIEGGSGNGITLGSFIYVASKDVAKLATDFQLGAAQAAKYPGYSYGIVVAANGCVHAGGGGVPPGSDPNNPLVAVSEGWLDGVRILDNEISRMGCSGIADFDPPSGLQGLELVAILEIERNRITGCAMLDRDTSAITAETALPGRGGIALISSEYVTVRDNVIVGNGLDITYSICGVWTGLSFGIVIERNQIIENGLYVDKVLREPGPRGGIVLELALEMVGPSFGAVLVETGFPAVRVHHNIVAAPSGPALAVLAIGTVSVQSNQLTSHGLDRPHFDSPYPLESGRSILGGHAACVFNFGWPVEFTSFVADLFTMAKHDYASTAVDSVIAAITGDTTFNDNQVLLDGPQTEPAVVASATAILSFGDISFEGNQCNAGLGLTTGLIFNGLLFGWSVRCADNRFQETLFHAALSAATWAFMNSTRDNQGTHCFLAAGLGPLLVNSPNCSLVDVLLPTWCRPFADAMTTETTTTGMTFKSSVSNS